MLKNKIPLHVFAGINFILLGLLPLLIFLNSLERNRYQNIDPFSFDSFEFYIPLFSSIYMLLNGLGYLLGRPKSRYFSSVLLFFFGVLILFAGFHLGERFLEANSFRVRFESVCIVLSMICLFLGISFYIHNDRVISGYNADRDRQTSE